MMDDNLIISYARLVWSRHILVSWTHTHSMSWARGRQHPPKASTRSNGHPAAALAASAASST